MYTHTNNCGCLGVNDGTNSRNQDSLTARNQQYRDMENERNLTFVTIGAYQTDRENSSQTGRNHQDSNRQIGYDELNTSGESEQSTPPRNVRYSRFHIHDEYNEQDWSTQIARNWQIVNAQSESSRQYLNSLNLRQLDTQNERNGQIPTTHAQSNYSSSENDQNSHPHNVNSHQDSNTQAEENGQYLNAATVDNSRHIDAQVARNLRNLFTRIEQLLNNHSESKNTRSIQTEERNWQYLKFLFERIKHYFETIIARNQEDQTESTQIRQNQQVSSIEVGRNQEYINRKYVREQTARTQQESHTQNGQTLLHSNSRMEQIQQSTLPVRHIHNRPSTPPYILQTNGNHPTFRRVNQRPTRRHLAADRQEELASGNQQGTNIQSEPSRQHQNMQIEYNWQYPQAQTAASQQESNIQSEQARQHQDMQVDYNTQYLQAQTTRYQQDMNIQREPIRHHQNMQIEYNWQSPTSQQESNNRSEQARQHQNMQIDYNRQSPQSQTALSQQESNIQSEQVHQTMEIDYNRRIPQAQSSASQQESIIQNGQIRQQLNGQMGWQTGYIRQYLQVQAAENQQELNTRNGQVHQPSSDQAEQIRRTTLPVRNTRNPSFYTIENVGDRHIFRRVNRRPGPSFPKTVVPQAELSELRCAICLQNAEEFKRMYVPVGKTICGHFFCVPCLWRWKKTSGSCPVCRQNVLRQPGGFGGFFII